MSIIIKHQTGQVFRIFRIKSYLTEVLEQPRGGTHVLNVAICDQRHSNVSKQRTSLADVDVALPQGVVQITRLVNIFHREINCNKNASFI